MMNLPPFDWERDYGPLYRACPSAFWLEPGPGDVKPAEGGSDKVMRKLDQAIAMQNAFNPYQSQQQATTNVGLYGSFLNAAGRVLLG